VTPGVTVKVIPGRTLRITGVSLGYVVVNEQQRTTLQLSYQPEGIDVLLKPTICSLLAGKVQITSLLTNFTHNLRTLFRLNKPTAISFLRLIANSS
jgi:hypothetical protein